MVDESVDEVVEKVLVNPDAVDADGQPNPPAADPPEDVESEVVRTAAEDLGPPAGLRSDEVVPGVTAAEAVTGVDPSALVGPDDPRDPRNPEPPGTPGLGRDVGDEAAPEKIPGALPDMNLTSELAVSEEATAGLVEGGVAFDPDAPAQAYCDTHDKLMTANPIGARERWDCGAGDGTCHAVPLRGEPTQGRPI